MEKILVVEDEKDIRENIVEILEDEGYLVSEADNGKEAWQKMQKKNYNLVVSDIMMPEMDGYQLLQEVRSHRQFIDLPFLFLTAKSTKSDVREGMNLSADDYITKPFKRKDLLNSIKVRLNKVQIQKENIEQHIENIKENLKSNESQKTFLNTILSISPELIFLYDTRSESIIYYNQKFLSEFKDIFSISEKGIKVELEQRQILRLGEFPDDQEQDIFEYEVKFHNEWYLARSVQFPVFEPPIHEQYLYTLTNITEKKNNELTIQEFYDVMDYELDMARSTQKKLIIKDFPEHFFIKFALLFQPMEKVGGDFLTYKKRTDELYEFFMGDVSGHGFSSAMVAAMATSIFKTIDVYHSSPSKYLQIINQTIQKMVGEHFITGIFLTLDSIRKQIVFSSAGHPPLALIRNGQLQSFASKGDVLILNETPELHDETIQLQPGDIIILFSDGFFESMNEKGEIIGIEAFLNKLQGIASGSLQEIIDNTIDYVNHYAQNVIRDDRTLFAMEVKDF